MITSEQAFDMLPLVVDIYEKLNIDGYRQEIKKKYADKNTDSLTVGIDAFKHILKNASKIKVEVFQIVALAEGRTVEEIKQQPFTKTLGTFKTLFADKELVGFFKSAMQ